VTVKVTVCRNRPQGDPHRRAWGVGKIAGPAGTARCYFLGALFVLLITKRPQPQPVTDWRDDAQYHVTDDRDDDSAGRANLH